MPEWPAQLPQNFLSEGFGLTPFDNATPIDVESGEPMTRLRFTGDLSNIQASIQTDRDGMLIFRNFWTNELSRGTAPFNWTDPMSGNIVQILFMAPPKYSNLGGSNWQIGMTLCMFA